MVICFIGAPTSLVQEFCHVKRAWLLTEPPKSPCNLIFLGSEGGIPAHQYYRGRTEITVPCKKRERLIPLLVTTCLWSSFPRMQAKYPAFAPTVSDPLLK